MLISKIDVFSVICKQMIQIDPSTRRPTDLPEWWKEQFAPHCVRPSQPLIIPQLPSPSGNFNFDKFLLFSHF
jgi:hypothetical protein